MREWENKLARLIELVDQEAEARAELENYDNIKSTVIGISMREAEKDGVKSVAAQKRDAEAGADYQKWCLERFAAAKAYYKAHLRRRAAEVWFDMARSEESSRRAEMTYQ